MRYQLVVRLHDGSAYRLAPDEDPACIFVDLEDCRARAREMWHELRTKPQLLAFVASEDEQAVAVEVCAVGEDRPLLSLPLPLPPVLQQGPVQ